MSKRCAEESPVSGGDSWSQKKANYLSARGTPCAHFSQTSMTASIQACANFLLWRKLMKVPAPRPLIAFVLATIIALVLMPCFGALSNRVVKAADRAFESNAAKELATSSEASLVNAVSAAPFVMQSPVMSCSAPSFSAPSYFGIGGGTIPVSIAVADFNLDGKPDLVTANQTTHNVSVLLGNGSGTYATATTFPSGAINPTSVA